MGRLAGSGVGDRGAGGMIARDVGRTIAGAVADGAASTVGVTGVVGGMPIIGRVAGRTTAGAVADDGAAVTVGVTGVVGCMAVSLDRTARQGHGRMAGDGVGADLGVGLRAGDGTPCDRVPLTVGVSGSEAVAATAKSGGRAGWA